MGSVLGETGKPQFTPPSTDGSTFTGGSTTPAGSLALVLLGLCALIGVTALVVPAKKRGER